MYCDDPDEECCPDPTLLRSYRGDTLLFQFTVYAPAPASGSPQNLTGWFLQFTAKYQTSDQDSQAVASAKTTGSVPNVITFPNGAAAGLVQVQVGPLSTISLTDGPTKLVYDVIAIDPSGNRTTIRVGKWVVQPSATRATSPS